MQPFSHSIGEPDRLMRMVGLSAAIHLAMIAGLVVVGMLAPPRIDFRDAIQVVLVPPSAPESRPSPEPDKSPPPAPAIPKPPPPPPPAQARREPVLAPLEDNPLWDKLDDTPPEESELARQFREMERAKPTAPTPDNAELEAWWKEMMASAPPPAAEAPPEETQDTPVAPALSDMLEELRAAEAVPEDKPLISGEMSEWLKSEIAMILSPGSHSQEVISDEEVYKAAIRREIESHWTSPDLFRGKGGTAIYSFRIERDGRISAYQRVRRSGSDYFDQTALSALLSSGPFPPLPESVKKPFVDVGYIFEMTPRRLP